MTKKQLIQQNKELKLELMLLESGKYKLPRLTASEALFGFGGWLTSRKKAVTFSDHHDAGKMANLVGDFCDENSLEDPREGWQNNLIHPKGECSHG